MLASGYLIALFTYQETADLTAEGALQALLVEPEDHPAFRLSPLPLF